MIGLCRDGVPSTSVSFESMYRVDPRLRDYPSILNFYLNPPQDQITLLEFEKLALDRLMVLLAIDSARIRAKSDADILKLIEPVVSQHLDLKRNASIGTKLGMSLFAQRQSDHYSHFILRLAYCKTPELQAWFVKQELALFRLRFGQAGNDEKEYLIGQARLGLDPYPLDSLADILVKSSKEHFDFQKAVQSIRVVYNDCQTFYKVPFENVYELLQKRQVICLNGYAYVPESERIVLVLNQFKTHLLKSLAMTAKALPRLDEDDRLMPILYSLAKQSLSKEYQISSGSNNEFRADDIEKLAATHFPPCMKSLSNSLARDSHLKHNGRIQYGLFLKGLGLSLDEALIFWRRSFNKMSDDEFQKKGYIYNIRYNYGMEGKRTNYTPYSCVKMISSLPGPGESHGCPFRHFSNERLGELMAEMGLDLASTHTVVTKAKDGHYQIACTKLFELTRGKVHAEADRKAKDGVREGGGLVGNNEFSIDSEGNFMLLEPIDHPNKYFDLSYNGSSRGGGSRAKNGEAVNSIEDVEMN